MEHIELRLHISLAAEHAVAGQEPGIGIGDINKRFIGRDNTVKTAVGIGIYAGIGVGTEYITGMNDIGISKIDKGVAIGMPRPQVENMNVVAVQMEIHGFRESHYR